MFCVCNVLLSVWWLCLIDFMLMCVVCMNWLRFSVVVVGSLCWCFVMYMQVFLNSNWWCVCGISFGRLLIVKLSWFVCSVFLIFFIGSGCMLSVMCGVCLCSVWQIVGRYVILFVFDSDSWNVCVLVVGLKCFVQCSVMWIMLSVLLMMLVSFSVIGVGCMFKCVCMNSGLLNSVCSWLSEQLMVGCDSVSCLLVFVRLCFLMIVWKMCNRFRLR